ncbi:BatA domain-containing protein [bacterium]|nr:BatA domain-containing protein [bacterium]
MNFGVPALLPWIGLLALPWILHLFLFRKSKTLLFPSVFFLKRCVGWSRRLKLRRLLLLLTRSALILYFVLSVLDPRIERAASSVSAGPALIVLDDRPAMRMKLLAKSESFLQLYRSAAVEELNRRPPESVLGVSVLSELALSGSAGHVSPGNSAATLRNAATYPLDFPAEPLLRSAAARIPPGARIIFFSPFQLNLQDPNIVRTGPVSPSEPNLSLLSLDAPAAGALGTPVSVRATVVDQFGLPADAMVRLLLNDRQISVARTEQGVATFLVGELPAARHLLRVEVAGSESDAYPDDNFRMAQIDVRTDRPVGIAARVVPPALIAALRALGASDPESFRIASEKEWRVRERILVLDGGAAREEWISDALARGAEVIVFGVPPESGTVGTPAELRRRIESLGSGGFVRAAFTLDDPSLLVDPVYLMLVRELISSGLNRKEAPPPSAVFAEMPLARGATIRIGPAAPSGTVRFVRISLSEAPSASASGGGLDNQIIPLALGYSRGAFYAELPSSSHAPGLYRFLIGAEEKGRVHVHAAPPPPLAIPVAAEFQKRRSSVGPFFFWIAVLLMAVELLLLRHMRSGASPAHPGIAG